MISGGLATVRRRCRVVKLLDWNTAASAPGRTGRASMNETNKMNKTSRA